MQIVEIGFSCRDPGLQNGYKSAWGRKKEMIDDMVEHGKGCDISKCHVGGQRFVDNCRIGSILAWRDILCFFMQRFFSFFLFIILTLSMHDLSMLDICKASN